jgi:BirA family biotin operon repressor/biotin-[acetyl-CoA-carboxylase] ligase
LTWQLRRLPVCASTERELDRWLAERQSRGLLADSVPIARLAVQARRQRFGHGQLGRAWSSPPGGLWLSAAFPWAGEMAGSASLGLAVAVGMAQQLETLGLAVQLKWPNDLLVHGRKLAGLLPRLRLRGGRIRWAQVGVGLNGCNPVPPGAISLAKALATARAHPQARPERLRGRVLAALDWASAHADRPELVRAAAEARLWRPEPGWLHEGEAWEVLGLHTDGRLRLGRGGREISLHRQF